MKKLFFLLLLMSAIHVNAQDVIVMKDGNTIVSKILEITTNEVKYKKFTNLEGPTYTVLKSEVKAINYANGEKETFDGNTPVNESPSSNVQDNSSFQNLSYEQLTGMVKEMGVSSDIDKKIKRLKIWGWIGGGTIAALGATGLVACFVDGGAEGGAYALSFGLVVVGAAWTTGFLVRAHNLKKHNMMSINSTPLFQHEFSLKDGRSLMAGVDMLQDARMQNSRTVGFGLRYNF